ncbi:MAG TPA: BamA/TamA family outer membrane protein [Ignavibacteriaceae bacterium]|nr:BamA/TamA family outer membrane protein [Ignavibacteriaceae bacterium]
MLAQSTEEKYELKSLDFEGNEEISSTALEYQIYSQESPWWFWKILHSITGLARGVSYYDSTNIPKDMEALKEYYNANGFFNAQFSYSTEVDTPSKQVSLTYFIKENSRSDYGKLMLYGLKSVPEFLKEEIFSDLGVDTTNNFDQQLLLINIDRSTNTLLNNGYMFAKYDSTIVLRDTVKNRANLNIYYSPGKRYTIDSLIVNKSGEGADLVDGQLLRDISGFNIGDYYDLDKIRTNQLRMYRTGLFNTITLTGIESDTVDYHVPLKIDGNIGLMNELSPEIILNNQQNAFNVGLGATYVRKNFLGNARKLTVSSSFGIQDIYQVNFGEIFKKFSFRDTTLLGYFDSRITVEQPYLFGRNIFGTWENYITINKQRTYNNTLYGSKLTFEFEMPRYTFVNFLSAFYNIEQSNEIYRTFNDSLSTKLISAIGLNIGSTTVDSLLYPSRGYNFSIQVEEANILPYTITKIAGKEFNDALFYKILATHSFYLSLNQKRTAVLAVKNKIGHIQAYYGDYSGIPINRTFYAGGSNSIRGWRANELVPKNSPVIQGITRQGPNVKGGTFLYEGSTEFRYRFLHYYGIAFFADYGNTWLNYDQFRFDDIAVAVGFGFRYYTLVAPIRIDFGFKFYDPADKRFIFDKKVFSNFVFNFGIGEAF